MSAAQAPARVLLADPPWSYGDALPGKGRGASKLYPCMGAPEIARFPLPVLADDAWLFLWRVHTHQAEAEFVMKAWGFTYCSELIWVKKTTKGKTHFGMGRTLRNAHEVCLIGKRGKPKPNGMSQRSVFEAAVGEHSAKPAKLYEIIETFSGGPYVELFARRQRAGWTSYGNQLRTKG